MGTRNLTCVVKDGEFKVAQYCQWDGYPSGQGAIVMDFIQRRLQDEKGLAQFNERVSQVRKADHEDIKAKWVECGADPNSDLVGMDVAYKFREKYPYLERSFGARILDYVFVNENAELQRKVEFASDSLFCEWAYVLDLDTNTFEMYRGFNQEPLSPTERFAKFFKLEERRGDDQYHPVKLFASFPFSEVNDETIESLVGRLEE